MNNQRPGVNVRPVTTTTASPVDAPPVGRIILVAATAALAGFLFGFDTAVINGAVGAIRTGPMWVPPYSASPWQVPFSDQR